MKTITIRASVIALLLLLTGVRAGRAEGSTELELNGLAERARSRQSAIEAQLQATTDAAERARLEDLSARNARVIAAYDARLGGTPAAPSNTPAAPESSGGGMFSGITSKLSGLMGGGSADNPGGPASMSFGGTSGGAGGFDIKTYLKENWPGLVGGMVGSIAGGMIGSRLAGGNKLAGIAGSLVGGWLGQKGGEMLHKMITGRSKGSGSGTQAAPTYAQQQATAAYTTSGGQPQYNAPGVQITYPQNYAGVPAAPPARNLSEARELMTGRYQSFLAAGSNPQLQATMYQNYMQSKQQYEQMLAQGRAQQQ